MLLAMPLATNALGNAIRFILTGGQRNDITKAAKLIENLFPDYVIAGKGYDATTCSCEKVIPKR
jgi:hypothetical protein